MSELKIYRAYSFAGQDPVVARLEAIVDRSGLSFQKLSERSGVGASTFASWFRSRKTKRPQFATIMAAARACGHDIQIIERPNVRSTSNVTMLHRRNAA